MKTASFAVALISAAALGTAAYAQSSPPPASSTPPTASSTMPAPSTSNSTSTSTDQKMALQGNWRASKLIGLNVYNEQNEKLGDINELIVDKNGKINAVVIGVGGFLGMGEHDIAVMMDKLKFVEEPVRTSSTSTSTTTTKPSTTTTGAASAPATTTTTTTSSKTNDWVPDHAVMSGTKDQLKAMPQFKYSDYN